MNTSAGPRKTVFGYVNLMLQSKRLDTWPVPALVAKWDHNWMQKWLYIDNQYLAKDNKCWYFLWS